MEPLVSIIAAMGWKTRVIGRNNDLLWPGFKPDMERFKELTLDHPVVMGRRTWESISPKYRPLPKRTNIVITRQMDFIANGATLAPSLESALCHAKGLSGAGEIFVIGGGEIYQQALSVAHMMYLTLVHDDPPGDTYFPDYSHLNCQIINHQTGTHKDLDYEFLDVRIS